MNNSMINPSIVDLLTKVEDRYSLVIVSSRRARQIIDGSNPLTTNKSKKPLTLAINEINEGSVSYHKVEEGTK
ncbi:DNA-directed RNA polymerase subunit omega [Clostridium sp. NSJ-6]|uniref:DNA-directed RNA polymerase subunit omega n=1 Tax=Clostridium hominis TaxID=2763036 RepID=A0ABR7DAM5_9CLOT|nr:DNA-directed RNA polymerase subunit omega [Clostridium hominis]MBC5628444.1 DNA-directed RNA polymerase subunit omega [Clostridium hominis]MDU2671089.1 DNA-directed RNA polymerase subunit omega [Clostridium sp.]SCJ49343.1 DNA-directed RNA polymerase subunit omega [uncultured Clostridium sp.]